MSIWHFTISETSLLPRNYNDVYWVAIWKFDRKLSMPWILLITSVFYDRILIWIYGDFLWSLLLWLEIMTNKKVNKSRKSDLQLFWVFPHLNALWILKLLHSKVVHLFWIPSNTIGFCFLSCKRMRVFMCIIFIFKLFVLSTYYTCHYKRAFQMMK